MFCRASEATEYQADAMGQPKVHAVTKSGNKSGAHYGRASMSSVHQSSGASKASAHQSSGASGHKPSNRNKNFNKKQFK